MIPFHYKLGAVALVIFALGAGHKWQVRKAVTAERVRVEALCQARIDKSVSDARKADAELTRATVDEALNQVRAATERAVNAETRSADYERETEALAPAVRDCRRASDADVRRLLRQ